MKIMFTTMSMQKGGAERVIANLSNYLVENNDVILVPHINQKVEYSLDNRIIIEPVNKNIEKRTKLRKILSKISIVRLNNLRKIILKEKPDIIISFLPEPSFKVLLLKKLSSKIRNIPTIVSVRNDPKIEYKNPIINFIMRKLYPMADGFVFQTDDAKKYFDNIIKCENKVIVNPVANEFIKERFEGKRDNRIVTVGRLEPQKNHKLLIDAFVDVYKKYPNYVLEIYGDGSLKKELENKVSELHMASNILFKGKSDNIQEDIYKAKAFIMTSDYEGLPNALLEAFVIGVPCISTDCPCGGPKYIISDDVNGILVEMNNKEQLVEAILKVIETDRGEMFSANANSLRDNFKSEKICDEWNEFIIKIGEKIK